MTAQIENVLQLNDGTVITWSTPGSPGFQKVF